MSSAVAQPAQARRAQRMPAWLRRPLPSPGRSSAVEAGLQRADLHTVCREARCPNRCECFGRGTATFLVMGDTCTRECGFCSVKHGAPQALRDDEPDRIVDAVRGMKLDYVVITSVTRDDLPDGGALHFARVVRALKAAVAGIGVEVLTPDFGGSLEAQDIVLSSGPDVYNHNVETVPRLYPRIRPAAHYERSLALLGHAAGRGGALKVKSGLMVGLGETQSEVLQTMRDLRHAGCTMVTIGQYLRPGSESVPVAEFIEPAQFDSYAAAGRAMGFEEVAAGPLVRSSYRAGELYRRAQAPSESR